MYFTDFEPLGLLSRWAPTHHLRWWTARSSSPPHLSPLRYPQTKSRLLVMLEGKSVKQRITLFFFRYGQIVDLNLNVEVIVDFLCICRLVI